MASTTHARLQLVDILGLYLCANGSSTTAGLLNPNRRHDDPDEQRNDMIRAEINASHRFDSFASERAQNFVKW